MTHMQSKFHSQVLFAALKALEALHACMLSATLLTICLARCWAWGERDTAAPGCSGKQKCEIYTIMYIHSIYAQVIASGNCVVGIATQHTSKHIRNMHRVCTCLCIVMYTCTCTVGPLYNGHHWDQRFRPLRRGGYKSGVLLYKYYFNAVGPRWVAIIEKVAAHQGWPLRGVPLYFHTCITPVQINFSMCT